MKLKYEYNGQYFEMSIKSIEKIEAYFKLSIRRKLNISINKYLKYLGFSIESCRICSIGDVPVNLEMSLVDGFIKINDFNYSKKIYCYGNNKKCNGTRMNPNSFEFISKVENISIDEANVILKERNNSPFYKENWKSESEYKKYQSRGVDYFIKKYGEKDGNLKYNEYLNKLSYSNSIDRYIDEYGEKDGKDIFNLISSKKDSMSYNYFLIKNNHDEKIALEDYNNKLNKVNNSVDNWINKYGYEKADEKHKLRVSNYNRTYNSNPNKESINKSKGITIENLYKKYGDYDIALKKYNNWIKRVTVPLSKSSKESLLVFNKVINWCLNNNIKHDDIYIGNGDSNEYFIRDKNNIFFYDFTIRSKKIIIEYNGVIFHPKNENSKWKNPFDEKITPKEAYNRQKYKIDLAKINGFSILEIWSDEDSKYEKCINFIKKNIKND